MPPGSRSWTLRPSASGIWKETIVSSGFTCMAPKCSVAYSAVPIPAFYVLAAILQVQQHSPRAGTFINKTRVQDAVQQQSPNGRSVYVKHNEPYFPCCCSSAKHNFHSSDASLSPAICLIYLSFFKLPRHVAVYSLPFRLAMVIPPEVQAYLDGPACPAPEGETSNLDNPSNSNGAALFVGILCVILIATATFCRAYSRICIVKHLHIEDCRSILSRRACPLLYSYFASSQTSESAQ